MEQTLPKRLLWAVAVSQHHRRRRGGSWRTVWIQPDGSITFRGKPVSEATVRRWKAAGWNILAVGREGRTPAMFPDWQQIRLTRPSEGERL